LNRLNSASFGNDPSNWVARPPSPGATTSPAGNPITILQQPLSQAVTTGQTVLLSVSASGDSGLRIQWRFNNEAIAGATNATLVLTNTQPQMSGEYVAVLWSGGSAAASNPAQALIEQDSDQDGMPDDWEFAHALNPFAMADASPDADGDAMSNLQEYLAGTNPRDAQSLLKLETSVTQDVCEISFNAAAFRNYALWYADSLNPAGWTKHLDIPARGADFRASVLVAADSGQRFYRLAVSK